MEQNSTAARLHALDGLRGIAILLVFLSHVNATFVSRDTLLGSILFGNGVFGVSLLFLLSGFLMAYLYPHPASSFQFIQKRYTRIFPLFLTITLALTVSWLIPNSSTLFPLIILIIFALIVHLIWVYVIKKVRNQNVSKGLFILFVLFQIIVGITYLWVMHHPAIFYYDQLSNLTRTLLVGAVNATLTLPLGGYVPMIDPVYWSLASEVLFYILYVLICVPIIGYFSNKNRALKIILVLSLLPFFVGITMLLDKVLSLSLLRFQLFSFFIAGMSVGYLYRQRSAFINNIGASKYVSYGSVAVFVGLIIASRIFFTNTTSATNDIYLALFSTIVFVLALSNKTLLSKILRSRVLVFIGTISYSIYLSHMLVFNYLIKVLGQPSSLPTLLLYIALVFICVVALSSLLYFLLEKPYFIKNAQTQKKKESVTVSFSRKTKYLLLGISVLYVLTIVIVYQSKITFFSMEQAYTSAVITAPKILPNQTSIALENTSVISLNIPANSNNFGVIEMNIQHQTIKTKKFKPQILTFRIKDIRDKKWYAVSHYSMTISKEELPSSFGFPLIPEAKGKTYQVELLLENPQSSDFVILDTHPNAIKSIYFVNKKDLIKQPGSLVAFIKNKMETIIFDKDVQQLLLLFLPFLGVVIYTLINSSPRRKSH